MKKILFTAFAVGLGLTASLWAQVPSYVPTNGLVGWWPFNGNANDESGNGNNGTVNGATLTADRFGNANNAYSFDGVDDYISGSFNNFPLGGSSRSISGWITLNNINSNYENFMLSWGLGTASTSSANQAFGLCVNQNLNSSMIWLSFGSSQTFNNSFLTQNNYFLCVTVDESLNGSFYLNGQLIGIGILSGMNTIPNGNVFNIGKSSHTNTDGWAGFIDGKLDDIGIWNRALTQQEIADLYNSVNCSNDLTISPSSNIQNIGGNASFTATTSDSNPAITWQSDFGQGFQTLSDLGSYSGANTNALNISNVQLANHNQQIRAISTSGNCVDTSNVAVLSISNTCTSNVTIYDTVTTNETIYDTTNVTIHDTLTTNVYDTLITTIYDTLTTNIFDTLTTNITVYDTITTNITIYDTLTTNVYDTTYITVSDTLLTAVTDTLIINTTLSLPAPNNENTILIYPNPASDHITIDNGNFAAMAGYSIKIENNAGQQVFQSAINQQMFYVDLSTWTGNGLYFVHLIDPQNNTVTVRKIVLQ